MIAILNYGSGNVNAIANIYKKLNIMFKSVTNVDELKNVTKIIIPGVGSFDEVMQRLETSGIKQKLEELVIEKQIPVLGICVGMHILGSGSEEGTLPGLNWIKGKVKKFQNENSLQYPIPHMGWNELVLNSNHDLIDGLHDPNFYFLHSYYFECENKSNELCSTNYNIRFSSLIRKNNIFGIQCHPEKSHDNGVLLLKNFAKLKC